METRHALAGAGVQAPTEILLWTKRFLEIYYKLLKILQVNLSA